MESEAIECDSRLDRVRSFLCGYRFCAAMMHLRRYERKRAYSLMQPDDSDELLGGNEAMWRARMLEVKSAIDRMKNGHEKLMLYYHYIQGESIERASDMIGYSRRTGYRLHRKGLLMISRMPELQREFSV